MYKERIQALMIANKEEPDDLAFIEERVNHMVNYVAHVAMMETQIQRIGIQGFTGEEYRDRVERLDSARRSKHEVAMSSVNQLNRLAAASGVDPLYDGPVDHEHRAQIGDLCQAVVNEYFEDRYARQLSVDDLLGENKENSAPQKSEEHVTGEDKEDFAASIEALSEDASLQEQL